MTSAITSIELTDFRSFGCASAEFAPRGLTVLRGANGAGKTNVLEAVHFLTTMGSFRASSLEALVRIGSEQAIVRGRANSSGRLLELEAEIRLTGRNRFLLNKQLLRRTRDLNEALTATVFTPDDLQLVKGGPAHRRDFLDGLLRQHHPRNGVLLDEMDRALRQRGALLRQLGGRLSTEAELTLDVWDAKLAESGTQVTNARLALLDGLVPAIEQAYRDIAGDAPRAVYRGIAARYESAWLERGLAVALAQARTDDLRRGSNTIGPHRDDLTLSISNRIARTHASQGEQRSLALALRLAGHRSVTAARRAVPILLLDDIFSELDHNRCLALLQAIPEGQAILTTAVPVPSGATIAAEFTVLPGDGQPTSPTSASRLSPVTADGRSATRVDFNPEPDCSNAVDEPGDSVDNIASSSLKNNEARETPDSRVSLEPSGDPGAREVGTF